jgi:exodeoxyribonuclease V alpha subunit
MDLFGGTLPDEKKSGVKVVKSKPVRVAASRTHGLAITEVITPEPTLTKSAFVGRGVPRDEYHDIEEPPPHPGYDEVVANYQTAPRVVLDDFLTIKGIVKKRIFFSPESGYAVYAVDFEGRKSGDVLQVTSTVVPTIKEKIIARGKWITYKGKTQFKAETIQLEVDRTAKGIREWLKGSSAKGIGKATREKLVKLFGDRLPEVIGSVELMVAGGMKANKAEEIAQTWNMNSDQPLLVSALAGFGLKPKQIQRVIEIYGASAKRMAETNPWEFTEIDGIGFPTADAIASAAKLDMTSNTRLQAGLAWVLHDNLSQNGHCGVPPEFLIQTASRLLSVSQKLVETAMETFVDNTRIIYDPDVDLVYGKILLDAEINIAKRLARLIRKGNQISQAEAGAAILFAEKELDVKLDREGGQFEAALMALCNPVCIITGGPGTGKSTTQGVIVRALAELGRQVMLGAPTGRAAKRLSETSNQEARTLHRVLEYDVVTMGFRRDAVYPLVCDVLIVDEFSMVDVRMASSTLSAVKNGSSLIIVGDFDQLPSVGPGQVLRDMVESGVIPLVRLTRVRRQVAGSGIAIAAQRIKEGLAPEEEEGVSGFRVVEKSDDQVSEEVLNYLRYILPEEGFDPLRDVQVLASMRRGEAGVESLNQAIKATLNPAFDDQYSVGMLGKVFSVHDRVMQTKNDYRRGVNNGEVGTVVVVGYDIPERKKSPFLNVDFGGSMIRYIPEDVEHLSLAYAVTVHKSQGCEFPVVIIVAPTEHSFMLNRNLLYTGITRAKTECVLIGSKKTIARAAEKEGAIFRHTGLLYRLLKEFE